MFFNSRNKDYTNNKKLNPTQAQATGNQASFASGQPGRFRKTGKWLAVVITIIFLVVRAGFQISSLTHSSPTLAPPPFTPADVNDSTMMAELAATMIGMSAQKTAQPAATPFTPVSTGDVMLTDVAATLDALGTRLAPTGAPTDTPTAALPDLGPFRFVSSSPVGSEVRFSLQPAPDGTLYALTPEKVYHFDGTMWNLLVSNPPAPLLSIDPEGRIWAASLELAAVWESGSWTQYGPESGWTVDPRPCEFDQNPGRVLFASDSTVWIAGCRDVRRFDGQNWQIYTPEDMTTHSDDGEGYSWEFDLLEAGDNIWVAECTFFLVDPRGGLGARWFDGQWWHGAGTPADQGCTQLGQGPDGSIWVVVNQRVHPMLYQYDPDADIWIGRQIASPSRWDEDRLGAVVDWTFDSSGDPWIELERCGGAGCGVGGVALYHYLRDSRSFVQVGSDLFYPSGPVVGSSQMLFDAQGEGWLFVGRSGSAEVAGIYQLIGEQFELVAAVSLVSAARMPDFKIWVSGSLDGQDGLWVLEP